mmetsp:Transcript_11758/g.17562  ORF Transcript_11758/g.17562 Transcript_11758/m.17562 type:complete len:154 (-) Transcript_11758:285-746(-)
MSLVAAAARASRTRAPRANLCQLQARRCLGETTTGPAPLDIKANVKPAIEFFTKDPVSYTEFKQQCSSLRIFAFIGVNAAIVTSLFLDPPKSSYWRTYSPLYLLSSIGGAFGSKQPLFLTEKVEREVDVPDLYKQLSLNRRIEGAEAEEEEEH